MENGKHIKVLTLQFDTPIAEKEVEAFRGAVIRCIGKDIDILYHNHAEGGGFRYSYPLIQYKRLKGKAAIVCVQEGVDCIGQFLMVQTPELILDNRTVNLEIQSIKPQEILLQMCQTKLSYHLKNWLPLNSENIKTYKSIESLADRVMMLEGILKANLLSMCKGLGIYLPDQLFLTITDLSKPCYVFVKGVPTMSFDVELRTNLSIPDGLGVGKNASIGFGTIIRKQPKGKNDNT